MEIFVQIYVKLKYARHTRSLRFEFDGVIGKTGGVNIFSAAGLT